MKLIAFLCLIVINMSCNSTKNKLDKNTDLTVKTELKKENQPIRKRMLVTLAQGQTGGFTAPQIRVVKDQEGLFEIYGQINRTRKPGFAIPKVDFNSQTIVGLFMGEKNTGGHEVFIQNMIQNETQLILQVKEKHPAPEDMVATVMTQPFCVVIVNNADKEFVFEKI